MPGHPDYKPPHGKPPHDKPPHGKPPHGKPPHHGHPPHYGHPPYYHDHWDDWGYWPVGAVAAGVVIGTIVATLPSGCSEEKVNGTTYYYCDGNWYLPYYDGGVLKYKIVNSPK
jgi:hypothetical protein